MLLPDPAQEEARVLRLQQVPVQVLQLPGPERVVLQEEAPEPAQVQARGPVQVPGSVQAPEQALKQAVPKPQAVTRSPLKRPVLPLPEESEREPQAVFLLQPQLLKLAFPQVPQLLRQAWNPGLLQPDRKDGLPGSAMRIRRRQAT